MGRWIWMALLSALCCSLNSASPTTAGLKPRDSSLMSISSCEMPNAPSCGVDYTVPSSIANTAAAIEMDIDGRFDSNFATGYSLSCRDAAKRIACAQRFPRCLEGGSKVELTSLQCEEMLRSNCGDDTTDLLLHLGYCALPNSTQEIAECKSVAEYAAKAGETGQLQVCQVDEEWRMTAWMYELLKFYDTLLASWVGDIQYHHNIARCVELHANFTCYWAGRCSADGETVLEFDITYELCERFIKCLPDATARSFRKRFNCSHWPDESPTPPCPSTASQPSQPSQTTWWSTNSQQNEPDVQIAAGSPVSGLGLWLQLVLTAISVFLVL